MFNAALTYLFTLAAYSHQLVQHSPPRNSPTPPNIQPQRRENERKLANLRKCLFARKPPRIQLKTVEECLAKQESEYENDELVYRGPIAWWEELHC